MGLRINIRLNNDKDSDIIEALSNAKNVTLEVKKLLRLGINCGTIIQQVIPQQQTQAPKISTGKVLRPVEQEESKMEATIEQEPKVVNLNEVSELEANLLSSFGFDDDDDDEEEE